MFCRMLGFVITFLMMPLAGFAQTAVVSGKSGSPTLGVVASNLTEATDIFGGVFDAMFYVIGIMLIVAGILRYRDFRQNPVQTPISRVVLLLIAGLVVGFFPFMINYMSGATSHYNV